MEFKEKYVGIIETTENANEYIIKNYIPIIQYFNYSEDTSFIFIEDKNKIIVQHRREKLKDNDVVTFDLFGKDIFSPFKNYKIKNLAKYDFISSNKLISKSSDRDKILFEMIKKNTYFDQNLKESLIGSKYEYILFENSRMFADVFNSCLKISEKKEKFPIRDLISTIPYSYDQIKNIIKSLIMLGYLEFAETLDRVIVRERLYKFNKSVLRNKVVIQKGKEIYTTVRLSQEKTDIQNVLSERFIIENFDKYAKPYYEMDNECRTYLNGRCPKCDSKEVTGSNLIKKGILYYYEGKCHKCGCNYVEYYNAYYVGTCSKKDDLIQNLECSHEDNDLIKCESICPDCKSQNIDINETDYVNNYNLFAKKCKCNECGREFLEWYALIQILTTYYNENNEEVIKKKYYVYM